MRKRTLLISLMMIFVLLLAACGPSGEQEGQIDATVFPTNDMGTPMVPNTGETLAVTPEMGTETAVPTMAATETVTEAATETPTEAATPTETTAGSVETTPRATQATRTTGGQPGSTAGREGIIGIPQTGANAFVGLGALYDFRVVDTSGTELGTVSDFVINACEANILYIVVDRADGQQILLPYQATLETPNNGKVDVQNREFVVSVDADRIDRAPAVDVATLDWQNPTWETDVMAYWKTDLTLSLTSGCNVPAGNLDTTAQPTSAVTPTVNATQATLSPTASADVTGTPQANTGAQGQSNSDRKTIYRVALASQVFGAELQEGNGTRLGSLRDMAILAKTGHVQFLVFEPEGTAAGSNALVALPPGAVTIEYNDGSEQPVFVLLVDTNIFRSAPQFDLNNLNDQDWFNYWDTYVPMTLDQLP